MPAKLVVPHMYESQVGYTNKAEKRAQIRIEMIEFREVPTAFVSRVPGRYDDETSFSMNKRLIGLVLIVRIEVECAPDADDLVDVCLERRRNAEIIHRKTDDEDISGQQFIDEIIANLQCFAHLVRAFLSGRKGGRNPRLIDMAWRVVPYVPVNHSVGWMCFQPTVNKFLAQCSRM